MRDILIDKLRAMKGLHILWIGFSKNCFYKFPCCSIIGFHPHTVLVTVQDGNIYEFAIGAPGDVGQIFCAVGAGLQLNVGFPVQ